MEGRRITIDFSAKGIFIVVFTLIALYLLYLIKDIVILFFIAFILTTALKPAIDFLESKRVPRWASIIGIYGIIILGLFWLVRLIIPPMSNQIQQLIENRQILADRVLSYLERAPQGVQDYIIDFTNSLPERISKYADSGVVADALGVFSGLLGFLTVFVVTFYLLLEKGSISDFIEENWYWGNKEKIKRIFRKISLKVSLWARGQLILSTAVGVLTFVGLSVLGVDFALTLALVAAVTELLPVVGPYIGAAPAVLIAFTESPLLAFWVMLLYFGVQQFEAQVLVPQVMKRTLGLSPVTIIFALLVGAKLLGILGVVIAVPVAAAIEVIIVELRKEGS